MAWLILVGRVLWATVFMGGARGHLMETDATTAYAAAKKVPLARPSVVVSGVLLVVTSLMVVLGVWPDLAFLLQAIWLLTTALKMHDFWNDSDPMMRRGNVVNFQKNLSLAGAALALFVLFAVPGGAGFHLALTHPLFHFSL